MQIAPSRTTGGFWLLWGDTRTSCVLGVGEGVVGVGRLEGELGENVCVEDSVSRECVDEVAEGVIGACSSVTRFCLTCDGSSGIPVADFMSASEAWATGDNESLLGGVLIAFPGPVVSVREVEVGTALTFSGVSDCAGVICFSSVVDGVTGCSWVVGSGNSSKLLCLQWGHTHSLDLVWHMWY